MRVLLLLGLVSMAIAVNVPAEQGRMGESASRIERMISKFLQLSSMSTQFDFNKLFDAIDELREGIKTAQKEEEHQFDLDFQKYVEDSTTYSDLITMYTAEVALHTEDLRSLNNHLTSYQEQLQSRLDELAETQRQKVNLEELIKQNEITFNRALSDFNAAIEVVDQALSLLETLRNTPVLLEAEQQQTYIDMANKMHQLSFQQHRFLYQPIVDILLSIAQNKLTDQDMLKKVLNMLQGLRNTLDGGRTSLIANYNSERDANLQLLDQYNKKIESLTKEIIPALQELIETTQEQIKIKTILLNDAQANLDDAIATLKMIEDRWIKRKIDHQKLMNEYDKELLMISQAVAALEAGGAKRSQ